MIRKSQVTTPSYVFFLKIDLFILEQEIMSGRGRGRGIPKRTPRQPAPSCMLTHSLSSQ